MRVAAVAAAVLALGCDDVSQEDTVFACDRDHPCPGAQVCSGTAGVCLDHQVLLYEDFEAALDASKWAVNEQLGSASVDETSGHWGDAALRVTSPTGGGAVSIVHKFGEQLPAHVFLRMFIQQADTNAYAPYFLFDNIAETFAINLHGEGSKLALKVTRDSILVTSTGGSVVANTWMCLEVEIDGIPATGDADAAMKVYLDDVEQPDMRLTVPMRAVEQLELGGYSMAPLQSLYDDVILDTQRVGCSR